MSDSEYFELWGVTVPRSALKEHELEYLEQLPPELPPNEWVWAEMDRVWDDLGLDGTRPLEGQPIGKFYEHPVWLMNGLFSAADPVSAGHRDALARYVATTRMTSIADYGGGFGELGLRIVREVADAAVTIVEPYPSSAAIARVGDEPRISFVAEPEAHSYGLMMAQDVLEHVEQPIELAVNLAQSVQPGGLLLFANNFTPIIKCHLPGTFHLRRTFRPIMRILGLRYRGTVPGADHAQVYSVGAGLRPRFAQAAGTVSRMLGPMMLWTERTYRRLRPADQ